MEEKPIFNSVNNFANPEFSSNYFPENNTLYHSFNQISQNIYNINKSLWCRDAIMLKPSEILTYSDERNKNIMSNFDDSSKANKASINLNPNYSIVKNDDFNESMSEIYLHILNEFNILKERLLLFNKDEERIAYFNTIIGFIKESIDNQFKTLKTNRYLTFKMLELSKTIISILSGKLSIYNFR